MIRRIAPLLVLLLVSGFAPVQAQEARAITWRDLIPEGANQSVSTPEIDHGGGPATRNPSFFAEPVMELDGVRITMPGFMLPLEYTDDGAVTGFLLVPYVGACIHVPPPPANQIVYVEVPGDPLRPKGMWDPVQVTGTMAVQMNINDLGDAAYTLTLETMEPYRR